MPNETEIDLDGNESPNRPVTRGSEVAVPEKTALSPEIAALGKDMTDDELLNALAQAPDDMLIPWEEVPLPSKGLYYEGWSNGTVRCRAMTQTVEKAFANRRLIQTGGALDRMFQQCVEMPGGMDPTNLLVGDRTFLLYYIRGLTYGNIYKFVAKCPVCGSESTHTYDMNELYSTVIYAEESLGNEPFKVVLPHLSSITGREMWVGVRFLRQADVASMMSQNRFNKKLTGNSVRAGNQRRRRKGPPQRQEQPQGQSQADMLLEGSLEKTIVSINGNTDPNLKSRIVARLHSRDNAAIREFMMEHTPGIDTTVTVTCQNPECGNEATMELPITAGFFRASE